MCSTTWGKKKISNNPESKIEKKNLAIRFFFQEVKKFKLGDPRTFHYLNQTNCYEVSNVDDAREYLETRNAMDIVGIGQESQVRLMTLYKDQKWWWEVSKCWPETSTFKDAIFRVVAAILHLGNVNFVKGEDADSSKLRDDKSRYHLQTAAELLMYLLWLVILNIRPFCTVSMAMLTDKSTWRRCNEKMLEDSLCKRVIVTPDGNITKPLDPESAALNRDALAKTVYSRLFDWWVNTTPETGKWIVWHFNRNQIDITGGTEHTFNMVFLQDKCLDKQFFSLRNLQQWHVFNSILWQDCGQDQQLNRSRPQCYKLDRSPWYLWFWKLQDQQVNQTEMMCTHTT